MGIGPMRFTLLLKAFHTVEKVCNATQSELATILSDKIAGQFYSYVHDPKTFSAFTSMKVNGISIIYAGHPYYPQMLSHISDPPISLYVKGEVSTFPWNHLLCVGVVGTRNPTSYGAKMTKEISLVLTTNNVIIASGLARGIDSFAHQAALDNNGKTVAVLGCGVDIIYPISNTQLYNNIIQTGNIIISEFPPGRTVLKGYFVSRNRIISGLSKSVVVVEGAKHSGALITARYAAEQGREVYAVPGPVGSTVSEGPHILIREGAKICTDPRDVLGDLQGVELSTKNEYVELSDEKKKVMHMLKNESCDLNTLAHKTNLTIAEILPLISDLELLGYVMKNADGRYEKAS